MHLVFYLHRTLRSFGSIRESCSGNHSGLQDLHFPLSMILDYRGIRVLATAALPAMADPRDLIDTSRAASLAAEGKTDDNKDGWEVAQDALRSRVEVLLGII